MRVAIGQDSKFTNYVKDVHYSLPCPKGMLCDTEVLSPPQLRLFNSRPCSTYFHQRPILIYHHSLQRAIALTRTHKILLPKSLT
jgi:hypothetical protein